MSSSTTTPADPVLDPMAALDRHLDESMRRVADRLRRLLDGMAAAIHLARETQRVAIRGELAGAVRDALGEQKAEVSAAIADAFRLGRPDPAAAVGERFDRMYERLVAAVEAAFPVADPTFPARVAAFARLADPDPVPPTPYARG